MAGLFKLIANLVVSGLLITLFPQSIEQVASDVTRRPLRAAGVRCLGNIRMVVAILGFAVIIIGLPVSLFLALTWAGGMIFANAVMIWLLGSWVSRTAWPHRAPHPYRSLVVGAALLTLIEVIPGLAWIAGLTLITAMFGSVLQTHFGTNRPWWPLWQPRSTAFEKGGHGSTWRPTAIVGRARTGGPPPRQTKTSVAARSFLPV